MTHHQFLTVAQSFQRTPSAQNVRWIILCCTVAAGTGAGQLLDGFNEIFPITKQPFLGLFIQEAVTFSLDQQVIWSIISDNCPAMYVTSLTATNAAISFNLGINHSALRYHQPRGNLLVRRNRSQVYNGSICDFKCIAEDV
ncbi:hypothetical protein T05_14236 [Trichinella murrelli]|uniref:Uncharacterized protein n=1 Tax=Trichinella murrelli TaxID=144512 RepID=A0A0V0U1C5_9BILA|nr:hypothetical protein T05_14236 [Trichinella murrelli]